ncbi:MAG: FAD-dependent oxidoreductase [Myxococcota bacterium]
MANERKRSSFTRRTFLQNTAAAGGAAAFYETIAAVAAREVEASEPVKIAPGSGKQEHVVIIGGGIAGLTTAYELLAQNSNYRVTILEASDRVGGRSHTLRPGDELEEVVPGHGKVVQTCEFEPERDEPYEPYLNAGPGRINSSHTQLLNYCKDLKVDLEVYVMESRSNFISNGRSAEEPSASNVNRHLLNDTRGWIAQHLYQMLENRPDLFPDMDSAQLCSLQNLLIPFGSLSTGRDTGEGCRSSGGTKGKYAVYGGDGDLEYAGGASPVAGFARLPEVEPGELVKPMSLSEVLDTSFWQNRAYQPEMFDWQPTLFQPVGGMDMVVHAFRREIERIGGRRVIKRNAVVTRIKRRANGRFSVAFKRGRRTRRMLADHVISNVPMPLLEGVVRMEDFQPNFGNALQRVFDTQNAAEGVPCTPTPMTAACAEPADVPQPAPFLADTCKVGWQGERSTWQDPGDPDALTEAVRRVVPIFGGISWSSHSIAQIWYPSSARELYLRRGVLTGAYNFGCTARRWGMLLPEERINEAREGARALAGDRFANKLRHGISVAWQNVPHIRGGWASWENLLLPEFGEPPCTEVYNTLSRGDRGDEGNWFLICGDQLSQLPGWQEGAVFSAMRALRILTDPDFECQEAKALPISRMIAEGGFPDEDR